MKIAINIILETKNNNKLVQILKDFILFKKNHNKNSLKENIIAENNNNENNQSDSKIVLLQ